MKILTITSLFPNAADPKHGVFIETRLKQLRKRYPDAEITVIAPVPWFPFKSSLFGQYSLFARAPYFEKRGEMPVYHPRYVVLPKVGMTLAPKTMAFVLYRQIKALMAEGYEFDLIDGHYFYPDGVAIAEVAKKLNKPFTVTARGSDINLIPQYETPRRQIQDVFHASNHNLAVCEALRQEMIALGAAPEKVSASRNGVDLDLFSFADEQQQREVRQQLTLPLERPIFLSVGLLIERKGHHLVIEAMKAHPEAQLLIAGMGPDKSRLKRLVKKLHLSNRVTFLGALSQSELARYFQAADLSVLASSREGWANVLLESMASGTPVVATNIWGTPEVVKARAAGLLVERNSRDIAAAIGLLLNSRFPRAETRQYAEQFSWDETTDQLYRIFSDLLGNDQPGGALLRRDTKTTMNDKGVKV
ncbi:glycosyltransferase family 4 protein [Photobacterium alginatilyticum]|uniref:glycosyltransferase family 4 protein n=1 Tax=Photobacterium alginatilyticum TaxID=1775171 RepID=UPI0040682E4A